MDNLIALIAEEILFLASLARKRLKRKAGITFTEKEMTSRSKKNSVILEKLL